MLHQVIEEEEGDLETLLHLAGEAGGDDLLSQPLNQIADQLRVSLDQHAQQLDQCDLEVILILVLLFDQSEIIFVEHVILVFDLLPGQLVVFLDPLQ